ncbi:Fanconi anemia group E protein-like isoform X2 [Ptychodera flava]|uniref:Fanconi anemia group E protein-like isoform X2 n=1 Tax=Ptychodera flava TaxID=63121 RepID=UPI003969BDE1
MSTGITVTDACFGSKVESICTQMELSSSSETFLHNFCHVICNLNPEPSFSNCCVIAKHCFLDKLQQLQQNASRSLLMSIIKFCESFPKPAIEGVLVPIACGDLGSPQVDVISRLTRETLSGEMRLHLYRSLCNIDMEWNPSTSLLFQTLLNTKLDLDEGTLTKFLSLLEHHGVSQQKCLKFGKVLLTTINKYGKQFSPSLVTVMSHILDVNRTYLKKTSAAALKKL